MPQAIAILCIDDDPLFLNAFKARLERKRILLSHPHRMLPKHLICSTDSISM